MQFEVKSQPQADPVGSSGVDITLPSVPLSGKDFIAGHRLWEESGIGGTSFGGSGKVTCSTAPFLESTV